jgi:hypothetical protein
MRARSARPANRFSRLANLCVAASFWPGSAAHAGSARDYLNAPVDTWLLNYNASYTTSLTPEDGTDTIPGIRSNVFAQSVVLTRIMDYWGRTGGLSLVLPYALIDTSAGPFRASSNGMSDVGFLWQMNIFGGPALTREEFHSFVPQTFSSFHLLVTTPVGTYQPSSPINPSANRWMVSPTVNFSYTPDQGWSWIETYVSGRFFTDNNNYLVNGAQTLTQKPLLRLEEHLSRNVTDALWFSADAYYNLGGETSIDGVDQDNMANTLRIGAGLGLRLWRGADLGLNYERVVAKPTGEPVVKHADRRHATVQRVRAKLVGGPVEVEQTFLGTTGICAFETFGGVSKRTLRMAGGNVSVGRIAGLQGSPREGPESAQQPSPRCERGVDLAGAKQRLLYRKECRLSHSASQWPRGQAGSDDLGLPPELTQARGVSSQSTLMILQSSPTLTMCMKST